MQVTLVQSEIESALTDYVNNIMSVKEGMGISVTFKATRGEEGATAIIDILPVDEKKAVAAEPVKRETAKSTGPGKAVADKTAQTATTGQTTSSSGDDIPATEEAASEEVDTKAEAVTEQTSKPSLFANLRK